MRSSPYHRGPGDYALDQMYDNEMRGPSQAQIDAEADAAREAMIDQARDDWDRERGWLIDEDDDE